jgi:anti-anti-sigma factor
MGNSHGKIMEVARDSDETCFVRLTRAEYGSLDAGKLAWLRSELMYLAEHSVARRLILDLSNIQYLGAGFVGVLVDTWHLLHKADRRLVLCGLTSYCGRLIRVLHLDKLFDICPAQGTAPGCMRQHVACEERRARGAPFHVRFTEVTWNADMVREEYLGEDGEPFRSVIRPRQRPTG